MEATKVVRFLEVVWRFASYEDALLALGGKPGGIRVGVYGLRCIDGGFGRAGILTPAIPGSELQLTQDAAGAYRVRFTCPAEAALAQLLPHQQPELVFTPYHGLSTLDGNGADSHGRPAHFEIKEDA